MSLGWQVSIGIGCAVVAATALADEPRDPRSCMDAATPFFAERGAEAIDGRTWFLREGRVASYRYRFLGAECIGFFAVGHEGVLDLDLALFTTSGIELGRDVAVDAHPYLRYCGAEDLEVVVVAHAAKGRGEVHLAVFQNPPTRLPDLDQHLGRCFASSVGVGTPQVDLGREPEGPPLDRAYQRLRSRLNRAGFTELADARREHDIGERSRVERQVTVEHGKCYVAAAASGPTVTDLDLAVRRPTGQLVAEDVRRSASARVSFCPNASGSFVLDLRMFEGRGRVRSGLFVLESGTGFRPAGVDGLSRIDYQAAVRRIEGLGMDQAELAWGWLAPGLSLTMPAGLQGGRCYAFAAVRSSELGQSDLDLVVLGSQGERVAWNLGSRTPPFVYFCPDDDVTVFIEGRVTRGAGRYLVLMGSGR